MSPRGWKLLSVSPEFFRFHSYFELAREGRVQRTGSALKSLAEYLWQEEM